MNTGSESKSRRFTETKKYWCFAKKYELVVIQIRTGC